MKELSQHAAAAKAIRAELKKAFPKTKFSVRSESYSMGDAVRVSYNDGPTLDSVDEIIRKYQYGKFDGMSDCYEYTNDRTDIPQSKFVTAQRTLTDDIYQTVLAEFSKYFESLKNAPDLDTYVQIGFDKLTPRCFIRRELSHIDLTNGFCMSEYRNSR